MIRKYSTIADLLFSSKIIIALQEKMKQFSDLFKMLMKEVEMTIGLMLTLKCVPSRKRCIVG